MEAVNRSTAVLPPTPRTEPTPLTRQLVANLTQLDLSQGPLTSEQAGQWKQTLQQLIQQGNAAVPAIREFLEQNRDWDLGTENQLGYPSLRAGLLDALQQVGGPEAQELMLQTLRTTALPSEIARLARYLDQQAPGQFREEIGTAVRETLAQATAGQLRGWDVGPLFQVLQTYGGTGAAADLEKSASKWNHYAVLSLANLPLGEGIPSLIRLAQESPRSSTAGVALEALAQVAVLSPEASATLLDLARSGKYSERCWVAAAAALGGVRTFIRNTGLEDASVPPGPGVMTYHLDASNQNYYSVPASGGMSPEQLNARISIIDQLLAVSQNPSVAEALQKARDSLLVAGQQARVN
jgi:hypothetical protein